jgi:hypothetical protein
MEFEDSLKTYLQSACTSVGERVTPQKLVKESPLPAITYKHTPPDREIIAHDGATGIVQASFELVIWAKEYGELRGVVREIKLAMNGYHGTMGSHKVDYALAQDANDGYDPTISAQRANLKLSVVYHENA